MNIVIIADRKSDMVAEVRVSDDLKKRSNSMVKSEVDKDFKSYTRLKILDEVISILKEFDKGYENKELCSRKSKSKLDSKDIFITIYSISLFSDAINKSFFKKWIRSNGAKSTGGEISQKEVEMWKEFSKLYAKHLTSFEFKNCSTITNKFNPKYNKNVKAYLDNEFYVKMNSSIKLGWDSISKVNNKNNDTQEQELQQDPEDVFIDQEELDNASSVFYR